MKTGTSVSEGFACLKAGPQIAPRILSRLSHGVDSQRHDAETVLVEFGPQILPDFFSALQSENSITLKKTIINCAARMRLRNPIRSDADRLVDLIYIFINDEDESITTVANVCFSATGS